MYINYLRASTINTWKDCQFKFFLNYVCGIESQAGKSALLGTCVHHVLELLAKSKKTGHYKLKDKYSDPEYLLNICWKRYTKNDTSKYTNTDYNFCAKQVKYVLDSDYNPLKLKILKTEAQFRIELAKEDFKYLQYNPFDKEIEEDFLKIQGTVDLIVEKDKNTLEIIDYKTGKRVDWITGNVKDLEDFRKDIQLRIYNLAASKMWPKYKKRRLTIIFTQDGGPFSIDLDNKDIDSLLQEIKVIFEEIMVNSHPSRLMDDRSGRNQKWKCTYVCQFGLQEFYYINSKGHIITKTYRYDKFNNYPHIVYENEEAYKILSTNGTSQCDRLYQTLSANKINQTSILLQPTINGSSSRRNDYSRKGIFNGRLS